MIHSARIEPTGHHFAKEANNSSHVASNINVILCLYVCAPAQPRLTKRQTKVKNTLYLQYVMYRAHHGRLDVHCHCCRLQLCQVPGPNSRWLVSVHIAAGSQIRHRIYMNGPQNPSTSMQQPSSDCRQLAVTFFLNAQPDTSAMQLLGAP